MARGIFERVPGSGIWFVRYADETGKLRREKVGPKSAALQLYNKRKTQIHLQEKLPENFRVKSASFKDLAEAALAWSEANKLSSKEDAARIPKLIAEFGSRSAEAITVGEFERYLGAQKTWGVASRNRWRALIKMIYRIGERDDVVRINPARKLRMTKEQGRIRWLSDAEEVQLRKHIRETNLPEFELAINTGMRRGEQYNLEWPNVDFERGVLTIPPRICSRQHPAFADRSTDNRRVVRRSQGNRQPLLIYRIRSEKFRRGLAIAFADGNRDLSAVAFSGKQYGHIAVEVRADRLRVVRSVLELQWTRMFWLVNTYFAAAGKGESSKFSPTLFAYIRDLHILRFEIFQGCRDVIAH
jgi:integrase